MPEIGEIKKGQEIGKIRYTKYIWAACELCGKKRWIQLRRLQNNPSLCKQCSDQQKRKMPLIYNGTLERPEIGDIRQAIEIRRKGSLSYIWHACIDCGTERWVGLNHGDPQHLKCHSCSQKGNKKGWRNGHYKNADGYIMAYVKPNSFFTPMCSKNALNHVLEHRLVVAKHLGRNLHSWEIVHHKNGIKDDNRVENLQLVSDDRHTQITILENRIKHLEKRVTLLEAENVLLQQEPRAVNKFRARRKK